MSEYVVGRLIPIQGIQTCNFGDIKPDSVVVIKNEERPIREMTVEDVWALLNKYLCDTIESGRNDSFCDLSNSIRAAWMDLVARKLAKLGDIRIVEKKQ